MVVTTRVVLAAAAVAAVLALPSVVNGTGLCGVAGWNDLSQAQQDSAAQLFGTDPKVEWNKLCGSGKPSRKERQASLVQANPRVVPEDGNLKLVAGRGRSVMIETDEGSVDVQDLNNRNRRQEAALEALVDNMGTDLTAAVGLVASAIRSRSTDVQCAGPTVDVVDGVCVARQTITRDFVRGMVNQYFNSSVEDRLGDIQEFEQHVLDAESRLELSLERQLNRTSSELQSRTDELNTTVRQIQISRGLGLSRDDPGLSCLNILQRSGYIDPRERNGGSNQYWIDPNGGSADDSQRVLCDMTTDGGGWTMVASNAHADRTFPRGTSRCNWFLEKPGFNQPERASMQRDYLFGPQMANLVYTHGRIYSNNSRYRTEAVMDVKWAQNNHRTTMRNNGYSYMTTNANALHPIGTNNIGGIGCGGCNSANLDSQRIELNVGGCNSNSNQRTIGATCTSNADPSQGTLLGHGSREGSDWFGEGNYYSGPHGCRHYDFTIYTTWVR